MIAVTSLVYTERLLSISVTSRKSRHAHVFSFFLTSCWLSLEHGLIWSFFGPVCLIIIINVFFFIVTVWRLAQKFTSLNPDFSKLHKIKSVCVSVCLRVAFFVFCVSAPALVNLEVM